MKLAWAFIKRDATIAASYRIAFILQLVEVFTILTVFYYIGKTLGDRNVPALARYGGNFLAFLLIGISFTDCVTLSLTTFAQQIRESQTTGTLEITLMSPVRLSVILLYSSLWPYMFSALRLVLYLTVGGIVYGVGMRQANLGSALLIFLLTVLCFMGIGVLWAGVVLLMKRGEAVMNLMGFGVILVSGVIFPIGMLPGWVQTVGALMPLSHALEGMRLAILQGKGVAELSPIIFKLSAFAIVLLTVGLTGFNAAVNVTKRVGSLSDY
jgi:ABC-2 type transport system permease protein